MDDKTLTVEQIEELCIRIKGATTNLWADGGFRRKWHGEIDALRDMALRAAREGHETVAPTERPSSTGSSVEKDAARYRWLRDDGSVNVRAVSSSQDEGGSWETHTLHGRWLDAAIDAARAQSQGTEEEK